MKKIVYILPLLFTLFLFPSQAFASTLFQDSFTDTDGTTLQAHNPLWVNVFNDSTRDGMIQSNQATTTTSSTQYLAYTLNGFSSQSGNQCIAYNFNLNETNLGVGAALDSTVDVIAQTATNYQASFVKQPDDTLTWILQTQDGTINDSQTTSQTFDWTQPHHFEFCDTDHVLSLKFDNTALDTTSDLNLYPSGEPLLFVDVNNTVDDFVYSGSTSNQAPALGTPTVTPSPTHVGSSTSTSASFSDADTTDTHTGTIDWGDGTGSQSATMSETSGSGTVSGSHTYTSAGTYTVTVTVKDSANATDTKSTSVTVVKQLTALDPASLYFSGPLLSLNNFNLRAEVYKNSTLVTTGEKDNVNLNASTALQTIPFSSFSPVDFPSGTALKIKVLACSNALLGARTATLHYNAPTVDSKFGTTIGTGNTAYHLLSGSVLGTSAGTSAQTVSGQIKCNAGFATLSTWTVTP